MKLTGGSNLGYQVAFNCAISQAFVCAVYVLFAVNERQSGAKHMQQIAGVKPLAYWGASLLWDWISYLTVIFSILLLLFLHGDPGYSSMKQMGKNRKFQMIHIRLFLLTFRIVRRSDDELISGFLMGHVATDESVFVHVQKPFH